MIRVLLLVFHLASTVPSLNSTEQRWSGARREYKVATKCLCNSRLLFTVITTLQGQTLFQLLNEDYCLVQGRGILIEYLNNIIY